MTSTELLEKLASGTASEAECHQFTDWFDGLSEQGQEQVLLQYESLISGQQGGTIPFNLAGKIGSQIKDYEQRKQRAKVIAIMRWSAAAVFIVAVAGAAIFNNQSSSKTGQIVQVASAPVHDRLPASSGAILTLADGSNIVLDSTANGNIATQGNVDVTKNNGQLVYAGSSSANTSAPENGRASITYNTLATPRGRQFQLTLPDGTKAWLNAASSIHYPTEFLGEERKVAITGEVYFEVAKLAGKPFKVSYGTAAAGQGEIEVLGTHFNINAYSDEPTMNTTLLEGSVRIVSLDGAPGNPLQSLILQPGKQAAQSAKIETRTADIETVMAWKNGRFYFNETPVQDILRQVARWYDIDVVYTKPIPEKKFTADLSRQTQLSEFLKILELSGYHFTIDAKTLTVTK